MNIIDKVLAPFDPQRVARRLGARAAIQAYEAARPSRTHKGMRETRSGDQAVKLAGKSIRDQARYMDENHDIVTGLFDRLEERIVGANGIAVEPLPLNKDGSVNRDLADQIKKIWAEWSLNPEVSGELTRPQMERLACRTWLRDGEVLAQHVRNATNYQYAGKVKYALEVLEPDYLPFLHDDNTRGIKQGIERDSWRRVRGYHVHKSHPADVFSIESDLKFVPAEQMIHLANRKRIGQARGMSILHSVLIRLGDLKDYEESERVAARIAAALTMFIKKGDAGLYSPNEATDEATGDRQFSLAPGVIFDGLAPGEDVGMLESNRPSALLEGFRNAMLRAVAGGTRVGYSTLSRDYNGTYSAQRQELVESQAGYEVFQNDFIAQWSRKVYRQFLATAKATRLITVPDELDAETLFNAVYMAPVMPWIDPKKEAEANKILVKSGFATESEVVRSRGRNPGELKRDRIREIEENREAELVFDSDAYHENQNQGGEDATIPGGENGGGDSGGLGGTGGDDE